MTSMSKFKPETNELSWMQADLTRTAVGVLKKTLVRPHLFHLMILILTVPHKQDPSQVHVHVESTKP